MVEAVSAIQSIKTALDIIKTIKNVSAKVDRDGKLSELYDVIGSLQNDLLIMQTNQSNLLKIKDDLEKKLPKYKNWEKEKGEYKLEEVAPKVFMYVYKKSKKNKEPIHWLCTNCYNNDQKSVIQRIEHDNAEDTYICQNKNCKFKITIKNPNYKPPSIPRGERNNQNLINISN